METNSKQIVCCVANYAYDASEANELTIRPGDVLRDIERLSGGFWRGELHGRHGLFPYNLVSLITEQTNKRPGVTKGRCCAIFSYQPAKSDELPLFEGDFLEVLEEVEEGWWRGIRAGQIGVFPSNFVMMLDPSAPSEPAPALPPKPVKEQCRVLFPYTAANYDELTLAEGDIVNILSKDAPDRGWWSGEVNGKTGYFPDNFVQLLPPVAQDVEEKKPDRPPNKTSSIYPALHKLSEKPSSVKELTTSKISTPKDNTVGKDLQTTVTHTIDSDAEELEWVTGEVSKKPMPLKKSPTPISGLLSGLKQKIMTSSEKPERSSVNNSSSTTVSSGTPASSVSSGGTTSSVGSGGSGGSVSSPSEWDRPDGGAGSKTASAPAPAPGSDPAPASASTFDHIERNSILNDPRAGRVKAPRRRPPSQALRDDTPQQIGLSNGHEVPTDNPAPTEKKEEIQPRAREWTKHRAPWMEELKLNQAKKTGDGKGRSTTTSTGSTDRIVECGLEERKSSHSMEMSKSTSSISSRISVIENLETSVDIKTRHSLETKKNGVPPELPTSKPPPVQSPSASGRTLSVTIDEIKKPVAPPPPVPSQPETVDKSRNTKSEHVIEKHSEISAISKFSTSSVEKIQSHSERTEKLDKLPDRTNSERSSGTLERRVASYKTERQDGSDALIAQLNIRILNLEKLIELQNTKFTAAIEDLNYRLNLERTKRQALESDMEKLAHCVTQV